MSTPFPQTIRALDGDGFRPSIIAIPLILLLLTLWGAWMMLARVPLYEISHSASLRSPRVVMAEFPASALGYLHSGQQAQVILDGFPRTEYGTLRATISTIKNQRDAPLVDVKLMLEPDSSPTIPLQSGQTGIVEIEIERVAPLTLFLRNFVQRQ